VGLGKIFAPFRLSSGGENSAKKDKSGQPRTNSEGKKIQLLVMLLNLVYSFLEAVTAAYVSSTVALINFASSSLHTKVHLKKKSGGRKTRRYLIGNQIPYRLPSSFFRLRFFFGVNFCMQTAGTCLHHTVLLVGVTDPCNSGVFIFESCIFIGLSSFSNAHNFVKNLV
jgi:hypothetical protein